MEGVKGSCSICGGRVIGFVGVWGATIPPPPGRCERCGAEEAVGPVIQMVPRRVPAQQQRQWFDTQTTDCGCAGGCKAWDCKNL